MLARAAAQLRTLARTRSGTWTIGRESGAEEEMAIVVGVGARVQLTPFEADDGPAIHRGRLAADA